MPLGEELVLEVDAVVRLIHGYFPAMREPGWGRALTDVSEAGRCDEPGQAVAVNGGNTHVL